MSTWQYKNASSLLLLSYKHFLIFIPPCLNKNLISFYPSTTVSAEALTEDAAQDERIYKGPRIPKRQKKPQQ